MHHHCWILTGPFETKQPLCAAGDVSPGKLVAVGVTLTAFHQQRMKQPAEKIMGFIIRYYQKRVS